MCIRDRDIEMNKKVYKTLEYNKILTMLSSYAACDETKKRCLSIEPITDLYEIRHLQDVYKRQHLYHTYYLLIHAPEPV